MDFANNLKKSEVIAVAVSGGADSLHSLVSMKEQGFETFAVHGILGQKILEEFLEYSGLNLEQPGSEEIIHDLKKHCAELDLGLHILDLSQEFLQEVILPFVSMYAQGYTPNPCVFCNARIKFGSLLSGALKLGATKLASGHYARLDFTDADKGVKDDRKGIMLLEAADKSKDQSYFLAHTPASQLSKALFPLGSTSKESVLKDLHRKGMLPPQTKESQEICFIPGRTYRDFLPFMAEKLGIKLGSKGPVKLKDGTLLGEHKGLWQYTEGQRRGLGIGWKETLHVLAKSHDDNSLILGPRAEMKTSLIKCSDLNLLSDPAKWPEECLVKCRYRGKAKKAKVELIKKGEAENENAGEKIELKVQLMEHEDAVASGQLLAIYAPEETEYTDKPMRILAGAIIKEFS